MKRKPTSAKKHKDLRRKRTADWDKSRENMEQRDRLADEAAHGVIKELFDKCKNPPDYPEIKV